MGVTPAGQIATFDEYARACADSTSVIAVLLTEASAHRLLPDWQWKRLVEPTLTLETWLVRQTVTREIVETVADLILETFQ